jgi:NOL1/NOP2/fmu family ribosome biogenesis protein
MQIRRIGDRLAILKEDAPVPPRAVFSCGVCLGQIEKGRLIPHHQLFSAMGHRFFRKAALSHEDAMRYLHGEELEAEGENGYTAVFFGPICLGGAKTANGRLKNHYPKGLRNP